MKALLRDLLELKEANPTLDNDALIDKFFKESHYIDTHSWSKDDITTKAEEMGVMLSPRQIDEVAAMMYAKHDANEGINWGTIECWIDGVLY